MDIIWTIAVVMAFSGAVGGLINYFLADPTDDHKLEWWKHFVIGIGAAFMVPLFLNMISSELITTIRGDGKISHGDTSKLYILAGFCLVAAVSSRAFIQSMSRKLLDQVRTANERSERAQEDAADAKAAVAPFIEEDSTDALDTDVAKDGAKLNPLTPEEKAILIALTTSRFSMRSMTGIANDTKLEKSRVNIALSSLINRGFIQQIQARDGGPRWYPTAQGRSAVTA